MDNRLFRINSSVVIGSVALAFELCASASHAGQAPPQPNPKPISEFSDTQLSPQGTPSAAVGNDMLLAQNVGGPNASGNYAEKWSTMLYMSDSYSGNGNVTQTIAIPGVFSGTGPTGSYPNTIGTGKHTVNTLAYIHNYLVAGNGMLMYYQYVVTDTYYDSSGNIVPAPPIYLTVFSYPS